MSKITATPDEVKHMTRMYERISDYIHENKIEQIVGEGASASPFIRLVKKAYRQRYGAEARPLNLVTTGSLLKFTFNKSFKKMRLLKKNQRKKYIRILRSL